MELTVFENEFTNPGVYMIVCENIECKTTFMTYLLYEYGILKKEELLFYSFQKRNDYYYRHLLAKISKIDKKLLTKYLYPWLGFSHYNTNLINRFYFVSAIEKIQQSNLFMIGENSSLEIDYLDSILEMLELDTSRIIVIEDFNLLLKKSKYNKKEIIQKLKECSLKYRVVIVLFMNGKKIISKLDSIFLVEEPITTTLSKHMTLKIFQNQILQKSIMIEYNKNNYKIEKKTKEDSNC